MSGETDDRDVREQIDDLWRQVRAIRADLEALAARADTSDQRADTSEARADAAQARADKSDARADVAEERADAHEARGEADHRRIVDLEHRVDVDEEMIAELQAEGLLSRETTKRMHEALRSSRRIGAAIGVLMATRNVTEEAAFLILATASEHSNRKLRDVAEQVVLDVGSSSI